MDIKGCMRLEKAEAEFVEWERVCRVATADSDGGPHAVPVCHVLVDGGIYFAAKTGPDG